MTYFSSALCMTMTMCVLAIDARIIVLNRNDAVNASFDSLLLHYGRNESDGERLRGHLVLAEPLDGCSNISYPPNIPRPHPGPENVTWYGWIALIERGNCYFDTKIMNAYKAHYIAAIMYNRDPDVLMQADPFSELRDRESPIPAVLIDQPAAIYLMNFNKSLKYTILLILDAGSNFSNNVILPFVIVMGLGLLLMVVLMVGKWVQGVRAGRRARLSTKHLKKLPITKFKKGDKYDVCAICLDEYEEDEKIRVLPCEHAYHVKCIDHWLTKRKRTCPICKRRLFAKEDGDDSETESENEAPNESDPLLGPPGRGRRRDNNTFGATQLPAIPYDSDSDSSDDDSAHSGPRFYQSSVEVHDSSVGLGNSLFYSADSTLNEASPLICTGANHQVAVEDNDSSILMMGSDNDSVD